MNNAPIRAGGQGGNNECDMHTCAARGSHLRSKLTASSPRCCSRSFVTCLSLSAASLARSTAIRKSPDSGARWAHQSEARRGWGALITVQRTDNLQYASCWQRSVAVAVVAVVVVDMDMYMRTDMVVGCCDCGRGESGGSGGGGSGRGEEGRG